MQKLETAMMAKRGQAEWEGERGRRARGKRKVKRKCKRQEAGRAERREGHVGGGKEGKKREGGGRIHDGGEGNEEG